MRARQTCVCLFAAALALSGLPVGRAAIAQTDADLEVELSVDPPVVASTGEAVRFWIHVIVPGDLLPVTILSLSSTQFGDVTDPMNTLTISSDCSAPTEYAEPAPGWPGWKCTYDALVGGEPGDLIETATVTVEFGDGTEVTRSADALVTISDQLGVLTGTMVDAVSGEPIRGIFLQGDSGNDGFGGFADSTGAFRFEGLEPGEFVLRSGSVPYGWGLYDPPPGYRSEYAFEYYDQEHDGPIVDSVWTLVEVIAGQATEIRWELSVGGAIEGVVRNGSTGEPVTDFDVLYWLTEPNGSRSTREMGGYADAGDDGSFQLTALRSGDYLVCVTAPLGDRCWNDVPYVYPGEFGDPVTVRLGETTTGIDMTLAAPAATTTAPTTTTALTTGGSGVSPILPATGGEALAGAMAALSLLAAGSALLRLRRGSPRLG